MSMAQLVVVVDAMGAFLSCVFLALDLWYFPCGRIESEINGKACNKAFMTSHLSLEPYATLLLRYPLHQRNQIIKNITMPDGSSALRLRTRWPSTALRGCLVLGDLVGPESKPQYLGYVDFARGEEAIVFVLASLKSSNIQACRFRRTYCRVLSVLQESWTHPLSRATQTLIADTRRLALASLSFERGGILGTSKRRTVDSCVKNDEETTRLGRLKRVCFVR